MYLIVGKPKTIHDLVRVNGKSIGELRMATPVAVIDDEIFPKRNYLQQHNFIIKELGDINDIKAVAEYQIILCDIKGVGVHFGSKFEGGHIIEQIRKFYPNKVIIAYTGERFDPTYNKFFQIADSSIKKDAEDEEWENVLDKAIKIANDPVEQWEKIRSSLIYENISLINLVRLEELFVNSVRDKKDYISNNKILNIIDEDIKVILLNLASSFLYALISGR